MVAFVYKFLSQFDTHFNDRRHDLDITSDDVVKTMPGEADAPVIRAPKAAFHPIAEIYGDQAKNEALRGATSAQ